MIFRRKAAFLCFFLAKDMLFFCFPEKNQRLCYAERSEAFQCESQSESEKWLEAKFLASDLVFILYTIKFIGIFKSMLLSCPFRAKAVVLFISSGRCPELN